MGIVHRCLVARLVLAAVKDEVVAHTASDETLLYAWHRVDGTIDVE